MSKTKAEKRKAKRKVKLKARRQSAAAAVRSEKADFFYYEHEWFRSTGNYDKALVSLKKALKLDPDDRSAQMYLRMANDPPVVSDPPPPGAHPTDEDAGA